MPVGKKPKRNRRRAVTRDVRQFYWLDEVADRLGLSERTLERDIADDLLIVNWFRGSRRVSERDLQAYIRKTRRLPAIIKRRRSPRSKPKPKRNRDPQ